MFGVDGCSIKRVWEKSHIDLEILQLFLGRFYKYKGKNMEKKYEFYPMMTKTLRNLIKLSDCENYAEILLIILTYPDCPRTKLNNYEKAIIDELDRQYERWNKGGCNGK